MAGTATTLIVAQAESGDTLQQASVLQPEAGAVHTGTETASIEEHEAFPPFDPNTFGPQLIWLAITFAILYFALSRAVLPRIGGIIQTRRTRIEGDLREAERLRQETEKAVATYEAALSEARHNAQSIAEETRTSIRGDIEQKRKAVESDLGTRMATAEASIQQTKASALANVDAIAAETAQALVERLSGTVSSDEALAAVRQVKGAA